VEGLGRSGKITSREGGDGMTKGDRQLLLLLVVVSLSLLAWRTWGFHSSARRVRVVYDGQVMLSFGLKANESRTYQLQLPGGVADLEVNNGAVRISPTSKHFCPERVCFRTGWIKNQGESIICAPNKLVIQIVTSLEDGIDAISR